MPRRHAGSKPASIERAPGRRRAGALSDQSPSGPRMDTAETGQALEITALKQAQAGGSDSDQVGQVWNDALAWDAEPVAEVVPEAEAELGAGLGQAEEGVAAVAAQIAVGAAADLAPGDLGADVVLRAVGVQRDLRWSSTCSSSALLACRRSSKRSSMTKPVRRWKMRSKRVRNSARRRRLGSRR